VVVVNAELMVLVRAAIRQSKKSVFSLRWKTGSDGHTQTDSFRLFQTDTAGAQKAQLAMVAHRVHEATMADTDVHRG